MEKRQKSLYLEIMRIFACFFVIFNHTEHYGFFLFSQRPVGGIQFFVYMFISIFCKFAVPLFFAISGALLLVKEEPLKVLWRKRILKMVVILTVFSFVYYLYGVYLNEWSFNLSEFFFKLYSDKWNYSYWYLYAYLSFLIAIPFLRVLVKNLDDKYFYYMFGLAIFFRGILPCINYYFLGNTQIMNSNLNVDWLCGRAVLYPCLGYFLEHRFDPAKQKRAVIAVCAADFAGILISCFMTYYRVLRTGECLEKQSQMFHESFVLINCAAVFMVIKYIVERICLPERLEKLILSLGSCIFGIYLLHIIILKRWKLLYYLQDFFRNQCGMNQMLGSFLICLLTMLIGYIMTLILKRIPVIRKLVS